MQDRRRCYRAGRGKVAGNTRCRGIRRLRPVASDGGTDDRDFRSRAVDRRAYFRADRDGARRTFLPLYRFSAADALRTRPAGECRPGRPPVIGHAGVPGHFILERVYCDVCVRRLRQRASGQFARAQFTDLNFRQLRESCGTAGDT
jgi:hypothetical protein